MTPYLNNYGNLCLDRQKAVLKNQTCKSFDFKKKKKKKKNKKKFLNKEEKDYFIESGGYWLPKLIGNQQNWNWNLGNQQNV